jgi:hypothetical protein
LTGTGDGNRSAQGDGRVRLRMLGEGDYDKIERAIQQLLSEAVVACFACWRWRQIVGN